MVYSVGDGTSGSSLGEFLDSMDLLKRIQIVRFIDRFY